MGFPMLIQKMKSPSPFLAAGFCLGVRWQGQGVAVRKGCPRSDAGTTLELLPCWVGFISAAFLGFADGLIAHINCYLFILVRGEVSCFSWRVWY